MSKFIKSQYSSDTYHLIDLFDISGTVIIASLLLANAINIYQFATQLQILYNLLISPVKINTHRKVIDYSITVQFAVLYLLTNITSLVASARLAITSYLIKSTTTNKKYMSISKIWNYNMYITLILLVTLDTLVYYANHLVSNKCILIYKYKTYIQILVILLIIITNICSALAQVRLENILYSDDLLVKV